MRIILKKGRFERRYDIERIFADSFIPFTDPCLLIRSINAHAFMFCHPCHCPLYVPSAIIGTTEGKKKKPQAHF